MADLPSVISSDLVKQVAELIAQRKNENEKVVDKSKEALAALYEKYTESADLSPGMIVQWKSGMKNRKIPEYNQPAIVISVLANPIYDKEESSGSPYFREPLDLVAGVIDNDGEFMIFHFDSSRFEAIDR